MSSKQEAGPVANGEVSSDQEEKEQKQEPSGEESANEEEEGELTGEFTVETLAGKTYGVRMCRFVGEAKGVLLQILLAKGLPYKKTADMRLLFNGRELHDRERLDECGVIQNSVVYLSIRRLACPCCNMPAIMKTDSSSKKRRRTKRQRFGAEVVLNPQKMAKVTK